MLRFIRAGRAVQLQRELVSKAPAAVVMSQ